MSEYQHLEHTFQPVFDARSRVLVLGSFPSAASRANSFYYGNPQNRFWGVIAACTGMPVPANSPIAESIVEKTRLLNDAGIALWDVIESCDIKGSSDASIRNARPVKIERILSVARIQAVFANGRVAEGLYGRYLEDRAGMPAIGLPSTSPANATWTLPRLVERWGEALGPYLG